MGIEDNLVPQRNNGFPVEPATYIREIAVTCDRLRGVICTGSLYIDHAAYCREHEDTELTES